MRLVREARVGDYPLIVKIEASAFESSLDARPTIRQWLDVFPEGLFVDWKGRGYCMTVLSDEIDPRNLPPFDRCSGASVLYMTNVAVMPRHQGKGIGRRLMVAALEKFKLDAVLTVHVENDSALHLYHSLGFRVYGVAKGHIDCGDEEEREDAYVMKRTWKPLTKKQRGLA